MLRPSALLSTRSVLAADASVPVTSLLRDVLTSCGATVRTANTASEARRLLHRERFDLILLDPVMDDGDGWDLLADLLERPQLERRTLVLSADRFDPACTERLRRSGLRVLFKPFDLDRLRALCARLIEIEPDAAAT